MVQTAQQAQALLDPVHQDILAELLEQPASAGNLAKALSLKMNTLHYRLRKLLALGLIEIAAVQQRSGGPIKVYRPTARVWDIPFELTPAATVHEIVQIDVHAWLERNLTALTGRAQDIFNLSFGKFNAGRAYLEYALSPEDELEFEDTVLFSQSISLTAPQVEALRQTLKTVLDAALETDEFGGKQRRYSLNVLFYPDSTTRSDR